MDSITVFAPAKINLFLDVVSKRSDGYHNLSMVMQTVSLGDTVFLSSGTNGISLECDDPTLPNDEGNIAYRAAAAFLNAAEMNFGVDIVLQKRIPHQAGLAGGSADAAAVLRGLNAMNGNRFSMAELAKIGVTLGADVPFCLHGGTALVEGIGEQITPVSNMPPCTILIAKPRPGISTAAAFAAIDACTELQHPDISPVLQAVEQNNLSSLAQAMANTLEQVCPVQEVFKYKEVMREYGALGSLMSGSGSAVFGLFDDPAKAQLCADNLRPEAELVCLTEPQ